jgi:hypothetical protein
MGEPCGATIHRMGVCINHACIHSFNSACHVQRCGPRCIRPGHQPCSYLKWYRVFVEPPGVLCLSELIMLPVNTSGPSAAMLAHAVQPSCRCHSLCWVGHGGLDSAAVVTNYASQGSWVLSLRCVSLQGYRQRCLTRTQPL